METPVLVLGRGCADLIRIAPWRGLVSGSVSCCCFSARTAAYSTRLCKEVCTTEEWENEGRIHASAKRQHLNRLNDGLECFLKAHTWTESKCASDAHFSKICSHLLIF